MVRNRRYARLRLASACTTKGLRCMKGRRSTICSSAAAGSDLSQARARKVQHKFGPNNTQHQADVLCKGSLADIPKDGTM